MVAKIVFSRLEETSEMTLPSKVEILKIYIFLTEKGNIGSNEKKTDDVLLRRSLLFLEVR